MNFELFAKIISYLEEGYNFCYDSAKIDISYFKELDRNQVIYLVWGRMQCDIDMVSNEISIFDMFTLVEKIGFEEF